MLDSRSLTCCFGRHVSSSGQFVEVPGHQTEELQHLGHHDDGDAQVEGHGAAQTREQQLSLRRSLSQSQSESGDRKTSTRDAGSRMTQSADQSHPIVGFIDVPEAIGHWAPNRVRCDCSGEGH